MLIQCNHCGAPLDVKSGRRTVQCRYCGTYSRIASSQTLAAETPKDFAPPETWTPPAEAPAESVPLRRRRPSAAPKIALAVGALVVLGGGFAWLRTGGGDALLREWYAPPCLVDANGDQVLDVAGLAASPGSSSWTVAVVDGRSGDRLWDGPSFPIDPPLVPVCVGGSWFGVVTGDSRAHFWDVSAPDHAPAVVPLPDHPQSIGNGRGCIRIDTIDGSAQAIAFPGGRVVPECAVDSTHAIHTSPTLTDDDGAPVVADGDTTWTLTARQRGTPFLSLRRDSGDRMDWSTDLHYVAADSSHLAMERAGDTIVVYASDPANDDVGVLLGIEARTGAQRYARSQGSTWSGALRGFVWNGRYVVAQWGFGLHAYDPATGERVWHIGGR